MLQQMFTVLTKFIWLEDFWKLLGGKQSLSQKHYQL